MSNHKTHWTLLKPALSALAVLVALNVGSVSAENKITAGRAQKLPDWSGIWAAGSRNLLGGSGGGTGALTAQGVPVRNPFFYTPAYQAKYQTYLNGELGQGQAYDPTTNCEPPGMPRLLLMPYPVEFMITPDKVVVLHEYEMQVRRIYTDGREHPSADELTDSYNGHSIGHWEGDTLVVETVGLKDTTLIDRANVHSDALRIVERIRRKGDVMEDQVTLTDAKAYTKPWTTTFTWDRKTGEEWDLKEYICQENNRNASDANGRSGVSLKATGR